MAILDARDSPPATTARTAPPWYTAVAASSSPAGRLAQAGAVTDAQVLTEAAKLIVSRLPGLSSMPRPEREWLFRGTVRMLTWAHRQAAPRSAESWLATIIPGATTLGLPGALSAAATSAINQAQEILTAVVSEPSEGLPVLVGNPNLSVLGRYPTKEQLGELERFGAKAVEIAKTITEWGEIDCTPDLTAIINRLRVAEKVAFEPAPPMPPPFKPVASNNRIGVEVHRLVTEQYVKEHAASLVVADRVVYAEGKRVGTLSKILSGRNKLPKAHDNGYTLQQLRFLDHSLRGGQQIFKRSDITDLTEKTVYEVKPRLGASGAVVQLWEYLAGYNVSAQFIPDGQPVRREQRKAHPYAPGQACKSLHVIAEGTWKPEPETFGPLPPRRSAVARVFVEPKLPGLLLYDVYAPSDEDEEGEGDALRAFLDLIRAIIVREILRNPFDPDPPPPPPPGNGKVPDDSPEEEEPQRPPWRPPAIDWDSPSVQVLKWVLIIATLVLLAYLAAAAAAAAVLIFLAAFS